MSLWNNYLISNSAHVADNITTNQPTNKEYLYQLVWTSPNVQEEAKTLSCQAARKPNGFREFL